MTAKTDLYNATGANQYVYCSLTQGSSATLRDYSAVEPVPAGQLPIALAADITVTTAAGDPVALNCWQLGSGVHLFRSHLVATQVSIQ